MKKQKLSFGVKMYNLWLEEQGIVYKFLRNIQ
jgi:hypothetical protein